MNKKLIYRVDEVTFLLTRRQPPQIIVTVHGTVPTSGWRNPELIPYVYLVPPADGFQDFCFVAKPPAEIAAPALTPIEATYTIDPLSPHGVGTSPQGVGTSPQDVGASPQGFGTSPLGVGTSPVRPSPLWVRGIRVHASSNMKEIPIGQMPGEGRVFVKGTLTDEGVECQTLRTESDELYTLAGDLQEKGFKVGDTVYVLGTIVPISFCMQGTTITIDWIGKEPSLCRA